MRCKILMGWLGGGGGGGGELKGVSDEFPLGSPLRWPPVGGVEWFFPHFVCAFVCRFVLGSFRRLVR